MPLTLRSLTIGLIILMARMAWADNTILKPPANASIWKVGGKKYCRGEVYLAGHQDTTALKSFGFRELKFVGRSLGNVKYEAMWPFDLDVEALPEGVSGLDYLLDPTDAAANMPLAPDEQLKASYADAEAGRGTPYRRVVVRDLSEGSKYVDYYANLPDAKSARDYDKDDISLTTRGNFHVVPSERGAFRRKESVASDYNPYQAFGRITPEDWRSYYDKIPDAVRNDPNLGTYRVTPVESGRYHLPRNVGTGNPSDLGTFRVKADPSASSLRPTDFGILKSYSTFKTGQSFFVTPGGGGIQDWQRVGGRNGPRTISWQEWQRQHRR